MKHSYFPFLSVTVLLLLGMQHSRAQSADDIMPYVQQHQKIAVRVAEQTGIPASILLSQAILEGNAGKNHLVLRGNNHFALKCGNDWSGETYEVMADEYDANGDLITSCFRQYRSKEASFEDFAAFLSRPNRANRFGFLFKLPRKDYQAWAYGIEQTLHPQQKGYATQLTHLIEDYKLNRFDNISQEEMRNEEAFLKTGFQHNNRVKVIYTELGQSLEQIAGKYDIKLSKLCQYNDLDLVATNAPFAVGTPIYLQPKKSYSHDNSFAYHQVKFGENMHQIAQMYGIRLKDLYKRNGLVMGAQPAAGQRIMLRKPIAEAAEDAFSMQETTAERALRNRSSINNNGFTEPNSSVFNREENDKTPSGELPAIVPQYYSNTTPAAPAHYSAPTHSPTYTSGSVSMSNIVYTSDGMPVTSTVVPESAVIRHEYIHSEPTLARKLTPIKPAKMSTPSLAKAQEQRVTTYVPSKQQPKGAITPYYLPKTAQKSILDYHMVRSGETLFGISRKYGMDVDTLKRLNRMKDNVIVEGQKLRVK